MLDLKAQHAAVGERLEVAILELVRSQKFILGPAVERFERAAAEYLGAEHAVGVSSGSDALVVALLALGIGPGREVLTTPFSFFATVESILRVGAVPRLVDIDMDDFALSPDGLEASWSENIAAILVAHLYGTPAKIERIAEIAARRKIPLIEDAAQAFGASVCSRRVGTFGALGCFSFHPSKPLGAWGDAGLVVCQDAALAERCRSIRAHGASSKNQHSQLGGNYRLDAIQAAVLLEKLRAIDAWLAARRRHRAAYDAALSGLAGISLQPEVPGVESSSALYTIRVHGGRRDALAEFLAERCIETAVHYPLAFHQQPALLGRVRWESLPEAELAASEVLSLPIYPELSDIMRTFVVTGVRDYFCSTRSTSNTERGMAQSGGDCAAGVTV